MKRKAVIDAAVPYIKGVLEPWFDLTYLPGTEIDAAAVRDADAMVIRTRTKCNAALLEGSSVKIITTATIGMDHIDMDYCAARGITALNAPGCNADAVMEWVFAALNVFSRRQSLEGATLGVIGVGQVGSRVADMGRARGFRVLENDPPLETAGSPRNFTPLNELLAQSDIVTIHIPLWKENYNFADAAFFDQMKAGAIFLNASRGGIVDEDALLAHRSRLSGLAVDVWKGEPRINLDLLSAADIATPHIAGYSAVGKINATTASVRAIAKYFNIPELLQFEIKHNFKAYDIEGYDIMSDDKALRCSPSDFELLRTGYHLRG